MAVSKSKCRPVKLLRVVAVLRANLGAVGSVKVRQPMVEYLLVPILHSR